MQHRDTPRKGMNQVSCLHVVPGYKMYFVGFINKQDFEQIFFILNLLFSPLPKTKQFPESLNCLFCVKVTRLKLFKMIV